MDLCIENARKVNPEIEVIKCSATSGEGMQDWYNWLETKRKTLLEKQLAPLKSRIDQIEQILAKPVLASSNGEHEG